MNASAAFARELDIEGILVSVVAANFENSFAGTFPLRPEGDFESGRLIWFQ